MGLSEELVISLLVLEKEGQWDHLLHGSIRRIRYQFTKLCLKAPIHSSRLYHELTASVLRNLWFQKEIRHFPQIFFFQPQPTLWMAAKCVSPCAHKMPPLLYSQPSPLFGKQMRENNFHVVITWTPRYIFSRSKLFPSSYILSIGNNTFLSTPLNRRWSRTQALGTKIQAIPQLCPV